MISSVRLEFTESFDQLLTAVEQLDKHVQSTEADLQRKMIEISDAYPIGSLEAKSTVVKPSTVESDTKSNQKCHWKKLDSDRCQRSDVCHVGRKKPIQAVPSDSGGENRKQSRQQGNEPRST